MHAFNEYVFASCVIFLVAFLGVYSVLDSRFIRKMLNLSFSSGVPTYGALTIATPIAIGVFLKLV
jgi:hypothetical protein